MLQTRKKKLFACLLIFLSLGVIGWFVFFEYSVKWLEERVELAIEDLRQQGYKISYSSFEITGTPLSLNAIIRNADVKDPNGRFEWQGQEIFIFMYPWKLYTLYCTLVGNQKVSFSPHISPSINILDVEGAKGTLHLTSKGRLEDITITVTRISSPQGNQAEPISLQDAYLNINHLSDPLNLNLAFTTNLVHFETLLNIETLNHPLTLSLNINLSGYKSNLPSPKSLADWRDGGGVLEVSLLKLNWAPIKLEAVGTLTLDKDMYPLGSFSSRIEGYQEALGDMVRLGWVKEKNATTAAFMLDIFSSSDGVGGQRLEVPITLQNRKLSLGPVSLLKLKPIGELF